MAEYWRGEITLRQVRVLLTGLPPDSAFFRAMRGSDWQDTQYLLLHLVNHFIEYRKNYIQAHDGDPKGLETLPAPGQEAEEKPMTAAEARSAVQEAIARGNGG